MAQNRVFTFETADGAKVLKGQMDLLKRDHPMGFDSLRAGMELLKQHGPEPGLSRFTRLRHTGGQELWELKLSGRPPYRALFAPIPGENAFVILYIVAKAEMAADNRRHIERALANLDHWLTHVYSGDEND